MTGLSFSVGEQVLGPTERTAALLEMRILAAIALTDATLAGYALTRGPYDRENRVVKNLADGLLEVRRRLQEALPS